MGRKLFTVLVSLLFLYVSLPLLLPVMMGGIFAVLFMPYLVKLETRKVPPIVGAATLTIFITLLIMIPTGLVIFFGAKSGFLQLQSMKQIPAQPAGGDWIDGLISSPRFGAVLEWITRWFPVDIEALRVSAHDFVHSTALKLADMLASFLTSLPGIILQSAVTVVSLFFFLLDGRRLIRFLRGNSIFNGPQTDQLFESLAGLCRSVILASIASGIAQTSIMVFGCLFMGIPNIPIIAAAIFMGSFVPVVGSTPVTIAVVLQQFVLGNVQTGFVMLIVGFMVATVDNFVRPFFLRGSANLHPLMAFVAAFGGLQAFGFVGVFLGPIIAGLFITTIKLMLAEPDSQSAAI